MNARRLQLLQAMALGPVWRLRAAAPADTAPAETAATETSVEAAWVEVPVDAPPVAPTAAPTEATQPETAPSADRAARIAQLDWAELAREVAACTACGLCRTRKQTVFGVGDVAADWMIVGEAPGAEEDARGEPFVGQAGRLLDNMLAAIGLNRHEGVYIANVLKCRPPGNRNPAPDEVAQCLPFLERQIDLVHPALIVAMGRAAAQTLLGTEASIASLRGQLHHHRGVPLIVTYHPAYLLRTPADKAKAWEDLCFARARMRELRAASTDSAEAGAS